MRKTIWASMFAIATFAAGREARAAGGAELYSGDTLRSGDNMLYGEVGWPDLSIGFQHGMSDKVDLGFRFSFIYGLDYGVGCGGFGGFGGFGCAGFRGASVLGLGMRVPIRIQALRRDKVSVMIHIDPGIKFDAFNPLLFGLWFPLGLEIGIHLTRDATLSFGIEMPIYVNLTNGTYGSIPILFGPGFNYHIDDHMSVGANLKLGPSIHAFACGLGNCSPTDLGLIAQGFFAYKL